MLPSIPPTGLVPPFAALEMNYHAAIAMGGDTHAHLPTLRALTELVGRERAGVNVPCPGAFGTADVVEFGVRGVVTTWALLAAKPRSLLSVDVVAPPDDVLRAVHECAADAGVRFSFAERSTLDLEPVECDHLFIDTLHTYAQLRAELERHAAGVRRYISFHDTVSFGEQGEDGTYPGLAQAVEELVLGAIPGTGKWTLRWHDVGCNGLAICERLR